jgi:glycosyltransferase involved in cell wall biosynthesis
VLELSRQQGALKPRILFLVPADYAALQRKGVDRMILERDEHGFFERVFTVHPLASRSQTIDLSPANRLIEFDLGRALSSSGSVWSRLAFPVRALGLIRCVTGLVRREHIDVIRATDPYLMGLLGWVVARLTGRPFCVSVHADYEKNFELTPQQGIKRFLRTISRWCPGFVFKRADLVLPVREHLAEWARRRGANPEKIRTIFHGIPLGDFQLSENHAAIRRSLSIPEHARIVSFAGRLSRYNYVYDVIAVAKRVISAKQDVVFVMMGDGEERASLEALSSASPEDAASIRLVGFRSLQDVAALRSASAVSLCLMGGFSLIEACAAGSAVVTYDVDWHSEVISDEVTGLLVREGNLDDLEAAVTRLLDDETLAHRLGAHARAFVEANYDERKTSAAKRECYEILLGHEAA